MKITRETESFRPIKLSIEIETIEELEALQSMTSLDESIPTLVKDHYPSLRVNSLKYFLLQLKVQLYK